jgi:glucan phosphoethanolaminetransferase (alkaline phosphatase superfamily)
MKIHVLPNSCGNRCVMRTKIKTLGGALKRLPKHITLAILFALLIYSEHKLFYGLKVSLADMVEFKHFVNVGLAYFLFSFIHNDKARLVTYLLLPFLTVIQRLHQAYFGAQIHPIEIWHLFIQFGDVTESFFGNLLVFILPFSLFAGLVTGTLIISRLDKNLLRIKYLGWVLFLVFLIEPYKTITGGNDFGKQPSATIIESYNLYGSVSFFLTKILPLKLASGNIVASVHVDPPQAEESDIDRNIIFVIGESVRYHNMSLFGYERKTTPFFDAQKKDPGFHFRKTVASGVSTDVSIPYLINALTGPDQIGNMLSRQWCLFRMAKEMGMKTYFFSTQNADSMEHIINYICPDNIDVLKTMDRIGNTGPLPGSDDHSLIAQLRTVDFTRSNFIVLHQRGSHDPYGKRSPQAFKTFAGTSPGPRGYAVDDYDDSILYGDHFFRALFDFLEKETKGPAYVIFTSDHGQGFGEIGRYGHSFFHEAVYGVPFVFKALRGEATILENVSAFPEIIRHYDIAVLIARLLGYSIKESDGLADNYYVSGLDIGFENGRWVRIDGNRIDLLP